MINNINNFGVINFYENNSESKKDQAKTQQVEDITPAQEEKNKSCDAYSVPIPREGDYNGVRLYIEERKKYDEQFKDFYLHHNRKELCVFLTKEFGWFVDDKSLGKNISRNIK